MQHKAGKQLYKFIYTKESFHITKKVQLLQEQFGTPTRLPFHWVFLVDVLWKTLLVHFCVLVWLFFSVFLIFCITSVGDCIYLQHQETTVSLFRRRSYFRTCLHGGEGPQIGEVTCGRSPYLSLKRNQIEMRNYMDRRVTPPKRVTSPTWVPHLHVNRP